MFAHDADYLRDLEAYPRQPLGVARNGGEWPAARHIFSLVVCARWEARYIVEWLNYHRSIGIGHVYLYCNDDDPQELYGKVLPFVLGDHPFVTFNHYSFQGLQYQMYFHFLRNYSHETKWLMFLDVDEFICLRGIDHVPTFMERFHQNVDAVYLNWCSFGHNYHATRPEGDVLLNYDRRERTVTPFTKVFIKSSSVPYDQFFQWCTAPVMHDYTCLRNDLNVRNSIGDDVGRYYEDFPDQAWSYLREGDRSERILQNGFIAHFNIKSDEDFILRIKRGLKGDYDAERMWGEKDEHQRLCHHQETNAVQDTYLQDYWKGVLGQGWRKTVFPVADWPLVSEGCAAQQVSTAHGRSTQEDAMSVLSGRLMGRSQNHTELETDPWWLVDLGQAYHVHEVRLFNRLDGVLDRMARFRIESSDDGKTWLTRHVKDDDALFGGADGTPYRWRSPTGFQARFLMLIVPGPGRYLQLDQVQVFGTADPAC